MHGSFYDIYIYMHAYTYIFGEGHFMAHIHMYIRTFFYKHFHATYSHIYTHTFLERNFSFLLPTQHAYIYFLLPTQMCIERHSMLPIHILKGIFMLPIHMLPIHIHTLYWKVFLNYLFFIFTYILRIIFILARCKVFTMVQPALNASTILTSMPSYSCNLIFLQPRQTKLKSLSLSHAFLTLYSNFYKLSTHPKW